jgi:hypothetical protein
MKSVGCFGKPPGAVRRREIRADVVLATASGRLIDACIHHFGPGGIGLIIGTPLPPGERFGFDVPGTSGTHTLFCDLIACRLVERGFVINASFLN